MTSAGGLWEVKHSLVVLQLVRQQFRRRRGHLTNRLARHRNSQRLQHLSQPPGRATPGSEEGGGRCRGDQGQLIAKRGSDEEEEEEEEEFVFWHRLACSLPSSWPGRVNTAAFSSIRRRRTPTQVLVRRALPPSSAHPPRPLTSRFRLPLSKVV